MYVPLLCDDARITLSMIVTLSENTTIIPLETISLFLIVKPETVTPLVPVMLTPGPNPRASIIVFELPLPIRLRLLPTVTVSLYVPGPTRIVSPGLEALTAPCMVE